MKRDGFTNYVLGGLIGMAFITLIILITKYISENGFHKPFDTIFYWIGSALCGIVVWGLLQIYKKIEGKSDKKDLESLEKVIMSKIQSEDDAKHEILTTMYSISGSIENLDRKFDTKLTDLNKTLIDHIVSDKEK